MFGCTTNGLSLVTEPSAVSTRTCAVTAFAGTVAVTCSSLSTANDAGTDPNRTSVVGNRPVPVIVTAAPTGPRLGDNEIAPGWAWAGVVAATTATRTNAAATT